MRTLWIAGLLFFSGTSSFAIAAERPPIRFEELPRLVRQNSEAVKAAERLHLAQRERTGYLGRSFLPRLSARTGQEHFKTASESSVSERYWNVEGRMNLYRGGLDRLESEARTVDERTAKVETEREYQKNLKEARLTFWNLVALKLLIKDREVAIEMNAKYIKLARRRSGAGIATNADTLQFQLEGARLEQDLKNLKLEQIALSNRLALLTGADQPDDLDVAQDFPKPENSKELPLKLETKNSLDVQLSKLKVERSQLVAARSQRWWAPRLDVYGTYGVPSPTEQFTRGQHNEVQYSAGIQLAFDLADSIENRREAAAKNLEAQAHTHLETLKAREVRAADQELRLDLDWIKQMIEKSAQETEVSERFLKLTHSEYQRGVKNGPDLLSAFQKWREIRDRRHALHQSYHSTRAEIGYLLPFADAARKD